MQWTKSGSGGAIPVAPARRTTGVFLLTGVLLIVLVALTLGLWKAQQRLDGGSPTRATHYVLWGGLAISALMSAAVLQALLHRAKAQQQTQKQLEAIESLHAVSTAIGARIKEGTALNALAAAAHRLLQMDRAVIAMLEEENGTLQVVASAGAMSESFPSLFDLKDLPASSYCLEANTAVFEGDTRRPTRPYGPNAVRVFDAASLILIPLRLNDKPIGLLSLSSSTPREFSDLDRRIGELLGSQASVVLSNQQLYEQMRVALESSQRLLRQRQALSAANAAIRSNGAIEEALAQIVRLVPAAIGTDVCGMTLLVGANRESVLAAVTPPFESLIGRPTGPNSLADEAFATRKPLIISNARNDPRLHASWQNIPNVGSILYIPMFRGDREPLGILALTRHQTGTFSQEQIELGQTFSALAALAVENTRLLEQTRDDAETKTVLLRELNHRVKNNLAGIVALLELRPPLMPADVQRWLDGATERIRSMAGAHQLFTTGDGRVPLESLLAQALSVSTVNKPANVTVRMDLNGIRRSLGPEQAVALAMVINELCHNALVHGLCEGGTLTIRARACIDAHSSDGAGDKVAIEVTDEGQGRSIGEFDPDRPAAAGECVSSSREGLNLVQGLVSRELKGTFALRPGAGGGTTAILEFPLPRHEL